MKQNIITTINEMNKLKLKNTRIKLIVFSIIIGIITGIVVVLYRISLDNIVKLRQIIMGFSYPMVMVLFFISSIIIQYLITKYPLIKGSGIPQVEGLLKKQVEFNWFFELVYKFFGGVLAIFMGLSLGREGPSIHLGSLVADGVNKLSKRPSLERKYLLTSGAASGLAAAFNAPLAGTIFALEELHKFFTPLVLICTLLASISSNLVVQFFIGRRVVLDHFLLNSPMGNSLKGILFEIFLVLILSIFIVIFAKLFNVMLTKFQDMYKMININGYIKFLIVSIIAFLIVIYLPEITGGGHELIEELIITKTMFRTVLILFFLKFIFTMFSYSTGAAGGIFLPMLVIGALIGKMYGIIITDIFNLSDTYIVHFMLISMAAYFSAIVKAPITGIVLILEMTGNFSNLFSLTIAAAFSYILADLFKNEGVYDILYERMFENKEKSQKVDKKSDKMTAMRIPVVTGSVLAGSYIKDIKWPTNMLVIGVERNSYEFIPNGNTKIYEGDKIIIFTDDNTVYNNLKEIFEISTKENVE